MTKATTKQDVDALMERLAAAREKAEVAAKERSRLEGQIENLKKRVEEIEAECRKDFGCGVDELPAYVEKMRKKGEEALAEAEAILSGDKVPAASVSEDGDTDGDKPDEAGAETGHDEEDEDDGELF